MDIKTIIDQLDLSWLKLGWKLWRKDFAGIAEYIASKLSAQLTRLPADKLGEWAKFIADLSDWIYSGVTLFVKDALVKDAAVKTCQAISDLATHTGDGEYTHEEIAADFVVIRECIKAWKAVAG